MYQNNNPYVNNYGYTYAVGRPQARNTQPLTPEEIAKLRQDSEAFNMKVSQEDMLKAACTHKEKDGRSALISNGDGIYTCTICHATFKMCDMETKEVEECVENIDNILQTLKTIYLDIPEDLARQYMQLLPLLHKLPTLWTYAMKNFSKYEGNGFVDVNPMSTGYSGFATLQNLMTNPYAGYGYIQQPMPGYAPQAPYGYQQPAPAPAYGAPMDPATNPMAYGVPNGVPTPTAPAPGVMPGVAQPAPAPAAPAVTPEVQQQQVFNV